MNVSAGDQVAVKIHKISGQLKGIESMYEEGRACLDIVQQIAAVRSALSSVARDLLAGEAKRCARCSSPQDFDKVLKTLVELT